MVTKVHFCSAQIYYIATGAMAICTEDEGWRQMLADSAFVYKILEMRCRARCQGLKYPTTWMVVRQLLVLAADSESNTKQLQEALKEFGATVCSRRVDGELRLAVHVEAKSGR